MHACNDSCLITNRLLLRPYDSLAPLTKWGAVMELMGNRSLHDVLYNGTCVMDGEMIGNIIQDIVSG